MEAAGHAVAEAAAYAVAEASDMGDTHAVGETATPKTQLRRSGTESSLTLRWIRTIGSAP